jgi:ubiquinone/menaquinone biosynthesis C-methylase UbiE
VSLTPNINEQMASAAFTKQSAIFDSIYSNDSIIRYKRHRVWHHLQNYLSPNSRILELNAGTGEDATELARQGHIVHATDISSGMLEKLQEKIKKQQFESLVTTELCSFTALDGLKNKGPYDCIFSNFAGLNCTSELDKVLRSFSVLLKPGGTITLVLLPRFCLWEFLLLFRGKIKTAFRRFSGKKGARAHIDGNWFRCWYYNPSYVQRHLGDSFILKSIEGLCTIVPPSYIEHFAEKRPKLYTYLKRQENKRKSNWPWKFIGDYYIITMKKREV